MRVGYHPDNLPFTYFSETGELIGFDIDMAQLLAREMKVKLEFIPFEFDTMVAQLQAGQFDLIMSGITVTTPRLEKMTYSAPYMKATLAFIVPDHRRNEFARQQNRQKYLRVENRHSAGGDGLLFMINSKPICPRPRSSR